jgi:hypothetical protein
MTPPSGSTRLEGVDIHAHDTVFPGHAFLGGPAKTIEAFVHRDVVEAKLLEKHDKLCLRQSTGDSTGP